MHPTAIVILSIFLAAGIYDAFIVYTQGVGGSISRYLQKLGFRSPVAMLVIGIIIGHLFFSMEPDCTALQLPTQEVSK